MKTAIKILFCLIIALGLQGIFPEETQAIKKGVIHDLAKESQNAGKETKEVLKADGESHENELVINDREEGEGEGNNIIDRTIKFIARVIGTLGVFALVVGGYFMIISNGDEQRVSKGKSILMYTVGGLIVSFLAYIIVQYVLSIIYGL